MAYFLIEKKEGNVRRYGCDYRTDIPKMPTTTREGEDMGDGPIPRQKAAPGSSALCNEDGSVWTLGKETDWTELE